MEREAGIKMEADTTHVALFILEGRAHLKEEERTVQRRERRLTEWTEQRGNL